MPGQNVNSPSSTSLPLFRPEPIAARLRMEGEVLLLRPLSLSLLTGFVLAIAAALMLCLLLVRVPDTRILSVTTLNPGAGDGSITFVVPQEVGAALSVGDRLPLTFTTAPGAQQNLFATVEHATVSPNRSQTEIAARVSPPNVAVPPAFYVQTPARSRSLLMFLLHREGK